MAPSWAGAPPVWVCSGWELLADEDKFAVCKMRREGVSVVWEEYEAMPHCFGLVLPHLRESRRCLEGWAGFVKAVVEGGKEAVGGSRFVTVRAKTLDEVEKTAEEVWTDGEDVVRERVWRRVRERVVPEEGVAKL